MATAKARGLRRSLLAAARAAVAAGLADAKALAGKTAVTAAQVREAGEIGALLRAALKPKKAAKENKVSPEAAKATDVRNRFWTLLQQRYDLAWRAGAYLWGKAVDDHVPPLQRHAVTRAAKPKEEAPATG